MSSSFRFNWNYSCLFPLGPRAADDRSHAEEAGESAGRSGDVAGEGAEGDGAGGAAEEQHLGEPADGPDDCAQRGAPRTKKLRKKKSMEMKIVCVWTVREWKKEM